MHPLVGLRTQYRTGVKTTRLETEPRKILSQLNFKPSTKTELDDKRSRNNCIRTYPLRSSPTLGTF
jgi:hypothetical protein